MKWERIREVFPEQWVLIEAVRAHSEDDRRILDDISVIDTFPDSETGLKAYRQLHRENPQREYLVVHTSHEALHITERRWVGIRP
jgi:hypothetical protein